MTDEDIVKMFAYLKTLKPVRHHVDNAEPPTFCKVCRQTHGVETKTRRNVPVLVFRTDGSRVARSVEDGLTALAASSSKVPLGGMGAWIAS